MNELEREELSRLRGEQARLARELDQLSTQLKAFEQRLLTPTSPVPSVPNVATPEPAQKTAPLIPTQPFAIPPIIRASALVPAQAPAIMAKKSDTPVTKVAAGGQSVEAERERSGTPPVFANVKEPSVQNAASVIPPGSATASEASPREVRSFEMRLGTFWLVRIGIVMVLTGLVFFGNLAYQNYISHLGPAGKVTLLYLASGALLGAGWWWQRKTAKESLRNYAQVLFAGGWAALYFTTYAAHHIDRLRVIQSPLVDGFLLFLCAGWMVWVADRKKSEVMALFAVALAYYTSIITRVGYFTLYSNLVLTVAAVCFLVRNRWAVLSFGSLMATYAAYGFWRFFDGSAWHWASPAEGLWSGTYFLIAYWIVFSSAVFLSKHEKFTGENRASFLTLNNGAFFTMFLLTMLQVRQGGFWKFALIYGGVLLILSELARRRLSTEPLSSNSYLTQGLLLVTVGLITKFAGLQLALILAAESVVILLISYRRVNMILRVAAYVAAGLAVGWGMDGMRQNEPEGLWLAIGLGAFMLVNAVIVHRHTLSDNQVIVRPQPSYFTSLALVIWLIATWNNTNRDLFPVVLSLEAVILTVSIYVLRIREVTLLSQGFVIAAQLAWFWNWTSIGQPQAWWNPALIIAVSLGLSHWWQKQRALETPVSIGSAWQIVYALAIVGTLYCWFSQKVQAPEWLVLSGGLAVALTVYGVVTRAWYVAAAGQIFVAISALQFAIQMANAKPGWPFALAPMVVLGVLSGATVKWFQLKPESDSRVREPLLQLARVYRWVALALSIAWICEYIPARERIWVLAFLGLGIFLWAGAKRNGEGLGFSVPFTVTALALFWLPLLETPTVYWPNLVAIVTLLAQRQIAARCQERYPIKREMHVAVIVIGGLSLWLFVSRWVLEQASGFYLTASWSMLALGLFTCGILLRERVYRWLGLGILASALGRVLIFDVWKLETLYRILSFMALGIVLLVLGFIYNKYQEKIREWL
jgi:uncharacterized membrane protein